MSFLTLKMSFLIVEKPRKCVIFLPLHFTLLHYYKRKKNTLKRKKESTVENLSNIRKLVDYRKKKKMERKKAHPFPRIYIESKIKKYSKVKKQTGAKNNPPKAPLF